LVVVADIAIALPPVIVWFRHGHVVSLGSRRTAHHQDALI
jgi:hypothetical protein